MPKKPAPPTLVLLVRHGVTPTTGTLLPGRAPGLHLYASPLERARETAAPIARARHMAVRIERDLADLDNGDWTGWSLDRARRRPEWEIVQRHPSGFRFPGGESFMEMQTRMTDAVRRLVERYRGQTIVVVSHADPIKAFVAHALGTPLDLFQRVVIAPASITVVACGRGGAAVLTVNSIDGDLAAYAKA
jgi:probable phosphoglycerate mutase